jgi:hypothetical protein
MKRDPRSDFMEAWVWPILAIVCIVAFARAVYYQNRASNPAPQAVIVSRPAITNSLEGSDLDSPGQYAADHERNP